MTIDNEPLLVMTMDSNQLRPLNPEEIAEYIHTEHTPYSQMSLEDGKKHLAELIQRYADDFASDKIAGLREPEYE